MSYITCTINQKWKHCLISTNYHNYGLLFTCQTIINQLKDDMMLMLINRVKTYLVIGVKLGYCNQASYCGYNNITVGAHTVVSLAESANDDHVWKGWLGGSTSRPHSNVHHFTIAVQPSDSVSSLWGIGPVVKSWSQVCDGEFLEIKTMQIYRTILLNIWITFPADLIFKLDRFPAWFGHKLCKFEDLVYCRGRGQKWSGLWWCFITPLGCGLSCGDHIPTTPVDLCHLVGIICCTSSFYSCIRDSDISVTFTTWDL